MSLQFRAVSCLTLSSADQGAPQQMHRDGRRALADIGAVAGQGRGSRHASARRRPAPPRSTPCRPVWSRVPPPGPAIPVIATAVSAPKRCSAPRGHRVGDRLRHRAVLFDQRGVDAEQLGLDRIGVGHHAAGDVLRRAGPLGEPGGQQARGARLGGGDACGRRAARQSGRRPGRRPRRRSRARGGRAARSAGPRRPPASCGS